MFEVGWSEMLVIAIVMIVIVGPKDLPTMLRTFGRTVAKLRGMAGDFQKQFNDALKEAELDDVKKSVDALRGLNPVAEIKKQLNPFEQAAADVRAGVDNVMKPKPAVPETTTTPAAEPTFPAMTDSSVVAAPVAQPEKAPAAKKTAKAKAAPVEAVAAKATPAKTAPAKATAAKAAPVKAEPAKPAPAKLTPTKAAPAKAAAKPAPAAAKPAATKKKTAGTAK